MRVKDTSLKSRWKRSLAVKQLTYIFLFSSIITLLGAAIQLYMEYRSDIDFVESQIEQIENIHLKSLSTSLWSLDENLIQVQLNSIITLQDILYLEIADNDNVVMSAGQFNNSEGNIIRDFILSYPIDGNIYKLGILRAVATMEGVYSRLKSRFIIILATQGIRTFFVSMFILFIIHWLVTRHVIALVDYTKRMELDHSGKNIKLDKKPTIESGQDEIDQLATALNNLRQRLSDTLARERKIASDLRESEERYRSLFSSVNEGVCLHEVVYDEEGRAVDYRILDANKAYEVILDINLQEAVGNLASQLYGTGRPPPYLDRFSNVAETRDPASFDTYFVPMNKHFKISVFSPRKGMFATLFADVTEQKEAETQIKTSLKEKEMLLSEIHHRVKNNMQVITSLLRLQSENIQDKQFSDMLKESHDRIRAMALVHEKLYQNKSFADIDFEGYVNSLVTSLFRSYGIRPDKIVLDIKAEDVSLGLEIAIPCGLIINELVSNSLKYAFPEEVAGYIHIGLYTSNDNQMLLEISDDGVGLPEDLDIGNSGSMGLHLVNILAEQLEGRIKVDRIGGTKYQISFMNPARNKRA